MSYYGSIAELPKDGESYRCNCIDGKCSGCGECCTDLLPLSEQEVKRIKEYAKKRGLKEHRQEPFFDLAATDFSCPFRDPIAKKCDIYPVRPNICRSFICTKNLEDAKRERDFIHQTRRVRSLKYEVFGNTETINFSSMVIACAGKRSRIE